MAATRPARGKADRDADFEYTVDDGIVRGVMALYGGVPIGSNWFLALSSDYARLAKSQRLDPLTHGFMEYGLCVIHQLKAEFGPALKRLAGARQVLEQSQYMMMYWELLRGQVAMAQGQVQDAESHYRRAQRIAKKSYLIDPVSAPLAEVVLRELALECNRISSAAALRNIPGALMKYGVPFSSFATASGLAIELRLRGRRIDQALTAARLRCLTASERFDEGRVLARELIAVAIDRRLRRTQMRALALSVVLEQRAGEPESAVGHLEEFLSLFAESPYAWPLVQERADCAAVVTRFLDLNPGSPYQETARSLLAAMRGVGHGRRLALSERERDVLRRLEGQRDKQIAAELELTVSGVRFHLRKLFTKLNVRTRVEAVRRARELGLIPDDS